MARARSRSPPAGPDAPALARSVLGSVFDALDDGRGHVRLDELGAVGFNTQPMVAPGDPGLLRDRFVDVVAGLLGRRPDQAPKILDEAVALVARVLRHRHATEAAAVVPTAACAPVSAELEERDARIAELEARLEARDAEVADLARARDAAPVPAVEAEVDPTKARADRYFRAALRGALEGALGDGARTLDTAELLAAGADSVIISTLDRRATGTVDIATFVEALTNATNYQTEDQAEDMLLDYTRVAVRIVENRHKAEERPWSLSDLVCRN